MKFEKTEVWGFEGALRGMRNPLASHWKSDSQKAYWDGTWNTDDEVVKEYFTDFGVNYAIGKNDMNLAQRLIKAGNEHCKFLRMIHVSVDADMPRYWWSEADTYHFNTKNSFSTMHRLLNTDKPITKDLFVRCEEDEDLMNMIVNRLEDLRVNYKYSTEKIDKNRLLLRAKRLLSEGFLQKRTWDTNYAELRAMYFQRRHHRLKEEWVDTFCKWVESLPYAKELIMYEGE